VVNSQEKVIKKVRMDVTEDTSSFEMLSPGESQTRA
jgi:hypothetical protein